VIKSFDDIEDSWSAWKCLYLEVLNKHAPIKKIKIRQAGKLWFASDLHARITQRDKIFKKA
jgi:hypothetical protein